MNQSKLKTFSLIVEFALIEFRFHWWLNEGGNVNQPALIPDGWIGLMKLNSVNFICLIADKSN